MLLGWEYKKWEVKVDPKSNRTYFQNKAERKTTWAKPAALEAVEWVEKVDPASKRHYFVNTGVSKARAWDAPPAVAEAMRVQAGRQGTDLPTCS